MVSPSLLFKVDGTIPAGHIEEEIKTKITNYLNSLKIGQPYEKKYIYNIAMKQAGVFDVTRLTPDTVTPTQAQIIRPGSITVEGV